ncbi:MAG: hypothetical protein Q8O19_03130 [Rectinemataceae bacterium]|nr:hypothetical protein [Rectinemataceae bacterium]
MKKLLLTIWCLSTIWSSSFATDVIVTTNGDVTAGVSRNHTRAMHINQTGAEGSDIVLIGEDSTSSTVHKLFLYYSNNQGSDWVQRITRPFTTPSGFASSNVGPIVSLFRQDSVWLLPPTVYTGTSMQARLNSGTVMGVLDTIAPAATNMVTGIMRWTGDTLIYAYNNVLDGFVAVVRSNGVWSQSVTWTAIDTFLVEFFDVNSDYCGSGVAIWDRVGRDLYWIDGTVNDAFKTLGTDKIPALLSTTSKNATTMAVYHDSMVVVIGYLARDTSLWEYRWWATGGTRKTGLTLIDSTKLLPKNYFSGGTSDSMSPMPCLMGTVDGDTATLVTRMWFSPSNADSIVLGYSTMYAQPGWVTGVAAFDSLNLTRNNISFGEGVRYRGLCASRYISLNAMVFWQKGISTPDSIWCSYEDKITIVTEQLRQIPTDAFSTKYIFRGASQIEDAWTDAGSIARNYGGTDSSSIGNGTSARNAGFIRPLVAGAIPFPSHVVSCSLHVRIKQGTQGGAAYNVKVHRIWKPPLEGTQLGADPGANPGVTNIAWDAANDVANKKWSNPGASNFTLTQGYNNDTLWADFSSTLMNTPWTNWTNVNPNTVREVDLPFAVDHWHKAIRGDADALGWVKIVTSADKWVSLWSAEAALIDDTPRIVFNVYFTEPGVRRNTWQQNFRRRYISPGFRRRAI